MSSFWTLVFLTTFVCYLKPSIGKRETVKPGTQILEVQAEEVVITQAKSVKTDVNAKVDTLDVSKFEQAVPKVTNQDFHSANDSLVAKRIFPTAHATIAGVTIDLSKYGLTLPGSSFASQLETHSCKPRSNPFSFRIDSSTILHDYFPMLYSFKNMFLTCAFVAFILATSWFKSTQEGSETSAQKGNSRYPTSGQGREGHSRHRTSEGCPGQSCLSSRVVQIFIDFWWADLEPLCSLHYSLAALLLSIAFQIHHDSTAGADIAPGWDELVWSKCFGWDVLFLPMSALLLFLGGRQSVHGVGSILHYFVMFGFAVITIIFAKAEYVYQVSNVQNCGHKWCSFTWLLGGSTIALFALLIVPEAQVASWLRKWSVLICAVMYINGGISKMLNSPNLWDWSSGEVIQYYASHQRCVARWAWGNQMLSEDPLLCSVAAISTLLFELPLSFCALLHLGGGSSLRLVWVYSAIAFHIGLFLVMIPNWNVQVYILVVFCLDAIGPLVKGSNTHKNDAYHASEGCHWRQDNLSCITVKALMAVLCTCVFFAWLFVVFLWHFPSDDPWLYGWPISSVPMYSMKCGNCGCDEKYRQLTFGYGR